MCGFRFIIFRYLRYGNRQLYVTYNWVTPGIFENNFIPYHSQSNWKTPHLIPITQSIQCNIFKHNACNDNYKCMHAMIFHYHTCFILFFSLLRKPRALDFTIGAWQQRAFELNHGPRQASLPWSTVGLSWPCSLGIAHDFLTRSLEQSFLSGHLPSHRATLLVQAILPRSLGDPTFSIFSCLSAYPVSDRWNSTRLLNIRWWGKA